MANGFLFFTALEYTLDPFFFVDFHVLGTYTFRGTVHHDVYHIMKVVDGSLHTYSSFFKKSFSFWGTDIKWVALLNGHLSLKVWSSLGDSYDLHVVLTGNCVCYSFPYGSVSVYTD